MDEDRAPRQPSGWAFAGMSFASVMLIVVGVFQVIAGIAAIIEDELFVVGVQYAYNLDVSGWGWIHLIIGLVLLFTGWSLITGKRWAAWFAIVVAGLAAVANFFWIPYYPFWSILIIAHCVWVIWSLTRKVEEPEL